MVLLSAVVTLFGWPCFFGGGQVAVVAGTFKTRVRFLESGRGGGGADDSTCVERSAEAYVRLRPRWSEGIMNDYYDD